MNTRGIVAGFGLAAAGAVLGMGVGTAYAETGDGGAAALTSFAQAFDPTVAEAYGLTLPGDDGGAASPLTSAELTDVANAYNAAGAPSDELSSLASTINGTEYVGQIDGGTDASDYLFTLNSSGDLAVNSTFANPFSGTDADASLAGAENTGALHIWDALNNADTTGYATGDTGIGTYLAGVDSQQDTITDLLNNPAIQFGLSFEQVIDDLTGANGGTFEDLFADSANSNDAGDLTVMFDDLTALFSP